MADNKKYYYLRLKENFFDSDEMLILESMTDGFLYSNILLKLYLRSLKNNGKLMFNDRIPFNSEMLSKITRHPVAVVEKAISIFKQMDLIEILDNGAIYILDIESFIGQSNTEADRKREYRRRIEKEKTLLLTGQMSGHLSDENPPEIEIDKEIDKEREKDILSGKPDYKIPSWLSEAAISNIKKGNPKNFIPRIPIAYLNQLTGKSFKFVDKNINLVKTRLKEGYSLEDFKQVIDLKVKQWLFDSNMSKYLRPETLFGSKFEGYFNERPINQVRSNKKKEAEDEWGF